MLGCERPRPAQVEFSAVHYDHENTTEVKATYRTSGPSFVAYKRVADVRFIMYSERKNLQHKMEHKTFRMLCRQVDEYNAVVQPIDNGPDDVIYLAETCTRVQQAIEEVRRAEPWEETDRAYFTEELIAACRANAYAAHAAIAYFNHHHPKGN